MKKGDGLAIVAAFLGGAVIGAAAGLLLAPEKGDDQRKKIREALAKSGVKLDKEELEKLVDRIKDSVLGDDEEEEMGES